MTVETSFPCNILTIDENEGRGGGSYFLLFWLRGVGSYLRGEGCLLEHGHFLKEIQQFL